MVRRALLLLLTILVLAAPARSQEGAGVPLYVSAAVDRTEVWVGQPVVWTFQVLRSVDLLSAPKYLPPSTPGFVALPLPQRDITSEVEGVLYDGAEVGLRLFPQAAGSVTVGPASVTLGRGAFSVPTRLAHPRFFQALFAGGETGVLAGPSFSIKVKPLPLSGRPPGFTGAVGDFQVSASLAQEQVGVGRPVTLQIVVAGEGNLGLFDPPALPGLPGFRVMETRSAGGEDPGAGQRTFHTVLEPLRPGRARIQGLAFAWFDPGPGRYRRIELPSLELQVQGALPLPSPPKAQPTRPALPGPRQTRAWRAAWPTSGWPLAAQALPLLALVLLAAWKPRPPRHPRGLESVRLQLQGGAGVAEALDSWLEERLGPAFGSLDRRRLGDALARQGVAPQTLADLFRLAGELDARRFSPAGAGGSDSGAPPVPPGADPADLAGRLLGLVGSVPELPPAPEPPAGPAAYPRWLVYLCLALAIAAPAALLAGRQTCDAAAHPAIARASAASRAGRPARAAQLYRLALDGGVDCADLWFALGCALEQAGDRPRARAAWEAALERSPRDPDVRRRREATLRALGLADPAPRRPLTAGEWLLAASLLAGLAVLLRLRRQRWAVAVVLGLAAAAGLLGVLEGSRPPQGIVVAQLAHLHAGPAREFPEVGRLRPGTRVLLGTSHGGWRRVRTVESAEGWIREEQLWSLPSPPGQENGAQIGTSRPS